MSDQPSGTTPEPDSPRPPRDAPPSAGGYGQQPQSPPAGQPFSTGYAQPGHAQPGHAGPGYAPPEYSGYAGPGGGRPAADRPFASLTDLAFTSRITPALARLTYLALIVLAALLAVVGIVTGISAFGIAGDPFLGGPSWVLTGLLFILGGPVAGLVTVAFGRFLLELFLDHAQVTRASAHRR